MKSIKVFALLLVVFVSAFGIGECTLPKDEFHNMLITNGQSARIGQFPYAVYLSLYVGGRKGSCGGTLITDTWVLTAAHCVMDIGEKDSVIVQLGSISIYTPAVKYTQRKKDIIIHHDFDRRRPANDIALIRIPAVRYTDTISSVKLPKIADTYPSYLGNRVVACGWGQVSDGAKVISTLLQIGYFNVISNAVCWNTYGPDRINAGNLCTDSKNKISTCNGDSGSPLVDVNSNTLIGVQSSVSSLGCEKNELQIFVRVTTFLPWIKLNTGMNL